MQGFTDKQNRDIKINQIIPRLPGNQEIQWLTYKTDISRIKKDFEINLTIQVNQAI